MRKLICGRYAAIRLILILLSAGTFFLPTATVTASLPYFERTVTIGASGLKPFLDAGLFSLLPDVLHLNVLPMQIMLIFEIALFTFLCAVHAVGMLFMWAELLIKPKTSVKGNDCFRWARSLRILS